MRQGRGTEEGGSCGGLPRRQRRSKERSRETRARGGWLWRRRSAGRASGQRSNPLLQPQRGTFGCCCQAVSTCCRSKIVPHLHMTGAARCEGTLQDSCRRSMQRDAVITAEPLTESAGKTPPQRHGIPARDPSQGRCAAVRRLPGYCRLRGGWPARVQYYRLRCGLVATYARCRMTTCTAVNGL